MYLSKSCIYAIRSALYLTVEKNSTFISIRDISKKLDIPFHYLTKILQTLSHAGIISSTKGPHGGVSLKKRPEKITLFDIICAFGCDVVFSQCSLGLDECSNERPCIMHDICYETRQVLLFNMKKKNLQQVVDNINSANFNLAKPSGNGRSLLK